MLPVLRMTTRTLFTPHEACRIILGGTDISAFWGFSFEQFEGQYLWGIREQIGDPAKMPWRDSLRFSNSDHLELQVLRGKLDFSANPGDKATRQDVDTFIGHCDIIGVNGPIGSGKDTVAQAMEPMGYTQMSFSDTLRLAGAVTFGVPLRFFLDRELKERPLPGSTMTPRKLIQLLGTEVVRTIDTGIWVNRMLLRAFSAVPVLDAIRDGAPSKLTAAGGIKIVNADVRFENEAVFMRSISPGIVRLRRPGTSLAAGNGHASEAGISPAASDIWLDNDGSKADFEAKVVRMMRLRVAEPDTAAPRRPRP